MNIMIDVNYAFRRNNLWQALQTLMNRLATADF